MTSASLPLPGVMPQITGAWVRLYSIGLSDEARALRRIDIQSDLWEHFTDRQAEGQSVASINIEVLGRLLRGVPSDIAWRFQVEGFQMNIHFPIERFVGLLLLLLIAPLVMGVGLSGYDLSMEKWSGEFARFAEMSTRMRELNVLSHAAIGAVLIATAAWFFALLRERSPRLLTLGFSFLTTAGVLMLVNAAVYRGMSGLADAYLASADTSLVATARSFGLATEALAMANMVAMSGGMLAIGFALARLGMVPRWTTVLPVLGLAGALTWAVNRPGDVTWIAVMVGLISVVLWLVICGGWLLLGGGTRTPAGQTRVDPVPVA
jgi:hypothetical protein